MWQQIFIYFSALILFGFVILGCLQYGLQSCYSAYAAKWHEFYPKLNIWSVVTLISAFLMVPVLLEVSTGSNWQFLGFLAPVSLFLVAMSPEYAKDTFQWWMHQVGAWGAVLFVLLYIILVAHWLFWIIIPLALVALGFSFVRKGTWMFWFEMATYLSTYAVIIFMLTAKV